MFTSVLIANRGEIAVRIIRTARRLGMRTIAVCSEADRDALHVRLADEARPIGPSEPAESYLAAERIIAEAADAGAECIHPGYGFLAENAAFAEACARAGIVFVGPPPTAIRAMGAKDAAKALMEEAGVPVVPGYHGAKQGEAFLRQKAYEVGYPLLIKAVSGGGGKGMRRVDRHQDFAAALQACKREAKGAFGDDRVLIERFVARPRHVEIQVFADEHGGCVHLFERDCSMQRRHQKVIEEAPAPGMTGAMRTQMGAAAVAAAKAVGYVGAGTVEFIADASDGLKENAFYFMEMNTRLQVEHPVTEAITGLDLVELQFRVAAGEPLPFDQDSLGAPRGHAIEARLYAEDPRQGFLPQSGRLAALRWPERDTGLRIDTGIEEGSVISPYYDPMVAKLIAHGETRIEALDRLVAALDATTVLGLRTNLGFLVRLLRMPAFAAGRFDTSLIDENLAALVPATDPRRAEALAAVAWLEHLRLVGEEREKRLTDEPASPWAVMTGWTLGMPRADRLHLRIDGELLSLDIRWEKNGRTVQVGGEAVPVTGWRLTEGLLTAIVDGTLAEAATLRAGDVVFLQWQGQHIEVRAQDLLDRDEGAEETRMAIRAPMSGRLVKLFVAEGDAVERGARLAILEAMKMEHPLLAGGDAVVKSLGAREGDQVAEGQLIVTLEAGGESPA